MSKLHDFLVEHAKFPFPPLNEHLSSSTTDISALDVDLLEIEWKAKLAVRDDTLVQKLCDTLQDILGDAPLTERTKSYLLANFSPRIQIDERGREDQDWSNNPSEAHVSVSGCSSFETEQFRADPGGRVGCCYTSGSSSPQVNVFGYTINLALQRIQNIWPKEGAPRLTTLHWWTKNLWDSAKQNRHRS
jgi:hypothetical protein